MTTAVATMPERTITQKQVDYMMAWRELWLDHVYWTRLAMLALVHDVPGSDQTIARLLRNADDMIGLLEPEYGAQVLTPLRKLLQDHLTIAAKLVTEAKQGAATAAETDKQWHQNAEEIAGFLSSANPHIPYDQIYEMFEQHLAMTKEEAVDRIQGQWDKDIRTYESIQSMALMMADAMSSGVIKQFPDTFV